MARKRKKSKARKKERKAPGGRASAEGASVEEEPEPEAIDPGPEPEVVDPEPEAEVFDLTLDDDLDDEAERARLIAAAAALAVEEDAPSGVAAADAAHEADDFDAVETAAADANDEQTVVDVRGAPDPDIPALTPAALAALTAIHREGLATLQGEFVIDLGDASSEEDRDRVLAAVLAHAEMQEAIYRVPADTGRTRRWKGTIASAILMLAVVVALAPPAVIVPAAPPGLSEADRVHGLRVTLLLQAQQVEAFRVREGRLPNSIDEVAVVLPDVRFVRSSNRLYQLVGHAPDGRAIVYDSAVPAPEFVTISDGWVTTRTGS